MSRIAAVREMLGDGRVGFLIDEEMRGTHHFVVDRGVAGEQPFVFRVTWGSKHLGKFLNPMDAEFMTAFLRGTVTVGGLCEEAECAGSLELRYFTEAKIRYTFDFEVAGRRYRYVGEKRDLRPWNLHRTHTTCFGTLTDLAEGDLISESITRFRLATAPAFLTSFRLA